METENYLQIMINSLKKKKNVLQQIVAYNNEQESIVMASEFDGDKFQKNMEDKSDCIDELNMLDDGFQSVYYRFKSELQ